MGGWVGVDGLAWLYGFAETSLAVDCIERSCREIVSMVSGDGVMVVMVVKDFGCGAA